MSLLTRCQRYYRAHREQRKAETKQYYREHQSEIKAKRKQLKEEVLTYYSIASFPQCNLCGITDIDVLCIDHIKDNGATYRKQHGLSINVDQLYIWLKQNAYPEGFQVLCMNCNFKKELRHKRTQEEIRGTNDTL